MGIHSKIAMGDLRIGNFFRIGLLVALRELVVLGELVVFKENWLHKKLLENYIVASRNWFGELVESRNWSGELVEFQRIGRILENWLDWRIDNFKELVGRIG